MLTISEVTLVFSVDGTISIFSVTVICNTSMDSSAFEELRLVLLITDR